VVKTNGCQPQAKDVAKTFETFITSQQFTCVCAPLSIPIRLFSRTIARESSTRGLDMKNYIKFVTRRLQIVIHIAGKLIIKLKA